MHCLEELLEMMFSKKARCMYEYEEKLGKRCENTIRYSFGMIKTKKIECIERRGLWKDKSLFPGYYTS